MDWCIVEKIIGETLPECIKLFLSLCGYDTLTSLSYFSRECLTDIETHISKNLDQIQLLDCCHAEIYKAQNHGFSLIPGHRDLVLAVSEQISIHLATQKNQHKTSCNNLNEVIQRHASLSVIMKELVKTSLQNAELSKNNAEYSDNIRFFATYVFILCGRSCYEVLRKNLSLPSVSTVCKYSIKKTIQLNSLNVSNNIRFIYYS